MANARLSGVLLALLLATTPASAALFPAQLHDAARQNLIPQVERLLKKGWDPNKVVYGVTPIHTAAAGNAVDAAKLLVVAGARIDERISNGGTALTLAARVGNAAVAEYLVSAGADVNVAESDGKTALIFAAERGFQELTKRLLARGANVHAASVDGDNALLLAARAGQPDIVEQLLAAGADVHSTSKSGATALGNAMSAASNPMVRILLAKGADWRRSTAGGGQLLRRAAEWGDPEILDYFIKEKIDVNGSDLYGDTALHFAARAGKLEAFQMLVASGADIQRESLRGIRPLRAASRNGHVAIAAALIGLGAIPTGAGSADASTPDVLMGAGLEHLLFADEQLRRGARARALEQYAAATPLIQRGGDAYRVIAAENSKRQRKEQAQALVEYLDQRSGMTGYQALMSTTQTGQLATVAALRNTPSIQHYGAYKQAYDQKFAQLNALVYGSVNAAPAATQRDDSIAYYQRLATRSTQKHELATAWLAEIARKSTCAQAAGDKDLVACIAPQVNPP